jgi:hypothetical protein
LPRSFIYYGVWDASFIWPEAVLRTVYRDATLKAVSIGQAEAEEGQPLLQPNDVAVYYTERGFILPAPRR